MSEDTQVVIVSMPDGSRWAIPAEVIARERAAYYAELDAKAKSGPEYDARFADELQFSLEDHDELLDYASNNMDWDELGAHAVLIYDAPSEGQSYESAWPNAEKRVVTMAMPPGRSFQPRPAAEVRLSDEMVLWLALELFSRYPNTALGNEPQTDREAMAGRILQALTHEQT